MSAPLHPDSPLVADLAPSPNFGDRRGKGIDSLILHYTGMATGAAALTRLTDATSGVSCHYLVWEDGRITQLVAEAARAWHAGRSSWAAETDMNSISIGIEIVNRGSAGGAPPYPVVQVEAVAALAKDICVRQGIAPHRVLAHSDIAPDRKDDPGEWFPWARLAAAGVGVFVGAAAADKSSPVSIGDLQRQLTAFGYVCPASGMLDADTTNVVIAFQRHFRPTQVDGIPDPETVAVLQMLMSLRPR